MKAILILAFVALAACGADGPPHRPEAATDVAATSV